MGVANTPTSHNGWAWPPGHASSASAKLDHPLERDGSTSNVGTPAAPGQISSSEPTDFSDSNPSTEAVMSPADALAGSLERDGLSDSDSVDEAFSGLDERIAAVNRFSAL
jgi:hypothetical protein